ncbi:MAG TPA: SDR family oxidoreductase [Candidatus Binatia bacterium]|nr:SDR family oxidoreductase [Candidatus Binatia bacterium]
MVTGAAQGLGATFALALAAEGAKVSLCDVRDPTLAVDAIRAAGGEAIGRITDVSVPEAVAALVNETDKIFGGVHILVNNAALNGSPMPKPLTEITSSEWERTMAVNVGGAFECVKAVVPIMRRQRYGKIINLSSALVFRGNVGMLQYLASKGALVAMTRGLARELGGDGIAVNCIAPGRTLSEAAQAKGADYSAAVVALRAIKREEVPADLVGTLVFLASPDSDFITGQTIVIDGGAVMH